MTLELPDDFQVQRLNVESVPSTELPTVEIVEYFRCNPAVAEALWLESVDKRYSPSTFLSEADGRYFVGWYSRVGGSQCVREFLHLEEAAADYLLFSAGKRR